MSEPLTLIESRRTVRTAPPANLPRAFASVTVPLTLAPWGIATALPTSTSLATDPEKVSPGLLNFEPTAEPRLTVTSVPEGTTRGSFLTSLASVASRRTLAVWEPFLAALGAGLLASVLLVSVLAAVVALAAVVVLVSALLSVAGLLVHPSA